MPDFARIRRPHVEQALDWIDTHGVPEGRGARTTFVVARGRRYPVKLVLGLACGVATGQEPLPADYTGGTFSAQFLQPLGYAIEHEGRPWPTDGRVTVAPGTGRDPSARARPLALPVAHSVNRPREASSGAASRPAAAVSRAIASVCVRGWCSRSAEADAARALRLPALVTALLAHTEEVLDAIVLPGGYFWLARFVGGLDFAARVAVIEAAPFAPACQAAAAALHSHSPGALLVVGIDSQDVPGEQGDQLCVAWGPAGVVGCGRKVMPVAGGEAKHLVINAADFGDSRRVVALPSGRRALLCSCYDGFGISDPALRADEIYRLRVHDEVVGWQEGRFTTHLQAGIADWRGLVARVDTALLAIHQFLPARNSSRWQRNGIATASAALGGGLVVAGAHFATNLPSDATVQTLASKDVPASELSAGTRRKGNQLRPRNQLWGEAELVRWYR